MPGLLILVPTLNEGANIAATIRRIKSALKEASILVIDDDSTDGTWQTATAMKEDVPGLDVMVRRAKPAGLGYSICDGYRYALDQGFEEVCVVDCDLQQDPADVNQLREKLDAADLVVGSRALSADSFVEGYDSISRLLSGISNLGIRILFRISCRDMTTDFFVMKTKVLKAVPPDDLRATGYAFFAEVKLRASKAGFSITEVPVPSYARNSGESKRSWRHVVAFAREILMVWIEMLKTRRGQPAVG